MEIYDFKFWLFWKAIFYFEIVQKRITCNRKSFLKHKFLKQIVTPCVNFNFKTKDVNKWEFQLVCSKSLNTSGFLFPVLKIFVSQGADKHS